MGTSLGDLLKAAGLSASDPDKAPAEEVVPDDAPTGPVFAPKVHLRTSKKGHGGKAVTIVTGILQPDEILRKLRKELGVGARIDGETVVINGRQTERIARWLESQGAKNVRR